MSVTMQDLDEQRAYYALCAKATAAGVPVSLDDPRSPRTVEGLRAEITRKVCAP